MFSIVQHWTPNNWLYGDGSFYLNVARGIIDNFSLRQETLHPHSWYDQDLGWNRNVDAAWSNIALGRDGEWWPKHPVLLPLAAVPLVWAVGPIGTLIFQLLCFISIAAFTYRIACRLSPEGSALAAVAAMLATAWFHARAWGFSNDVFYSVILLACVDCAIAGRARGAGLLFGIGVFAKSTNVLYGPALVGLFLLRKDWRGALNVILSGAIPVLAYFGLNYWMYTSPFKTGYHRILVREAGKLALHSISQDFHFEKQAFLQGLHTILFSKSGFWQHFPLFFLGVLGLFVLARRAWREALVLSWCLTIPILFHAPYRWYRLDFNIPQIALAMVPFAALLSPLAALPAPTAFRLRIKPALTFALVALLFGAIVHRVAGPKDSYFWRELRQARSYLGAYSCDYFNNLSERWECTSYDKSAWLQVGRTLSPELHWGDDRERMLLLHPHTTGMLRRLEYPETPMSRVLRLRYGMASSARKDAQAHFKVLIDGKTVLDEQVTGRGVVDKRIDTSAWNGRSAMISLQVEGDRRGAGCVFGVAGGPQ